MPSKAVSTSLAIAQLLRERRETLGLTLRAVAALSGEHGNPIPHSTLARIEGAQLDPGARRLQRLLRLYDLPAQVAGDLLDIEELAGAIPMERDPAKLRERAIAAWRAGRVSEAISSFLAFRNRTSNSPEHRAMRHDAIVHFAIAASSLGKHQLARQMLDNLLIERPEPKVLVSVLVQQSVIWRSLGSTDAALAFIERAAVHVPAEAHLQSGWIRHQRALIQIDAGDHHAAALSLKDAERAYTRAGSPHDRGLVLLSFARLGFERGRPQEALVAARRAARYAKRNGFARLHLCAQVDESRALQLHGDFAASRETLRALLASSVAAGDNLLRFYAHFYLWKAELVGGDPARADVELREAGYYLKFVDQSSPEAIEVRQRILSRS